MVSPRVPLVQYPCYFQGFPWSSIYSVFVIVHCFPHLGHKSEEKKLAAAILATTVLAGIVTLLQLVFQMPMDTHEDPGFNTVYPFIRIAPL